MRFAIDIPIMGEHYSDARYVAEMAHEAEESGWDGFFIWDHIGSDWPKPVGDPWIMMSAIAMRTQHIKIGPLVTPVPRRRPWKLARETVALDHLSDGRLMFGVGIGSDNGREYSCYHEAPEDRVHAEMLDEGLDVLTGLWSGEPFSFDGKHYQIENAHYLPKPVQPHIPIWVAGFWPAKRPFRRAARWDGMFPLSGTVVDDPLAQMSVDEMRAAVEYTLEQRGTDDRPFDVLHGGVLEGKDRASDAALVEEYAAVGVTWWVENIHDRRGPLDEQRARIRQGPPR